VAKNIVLTGFMGTGKSAIGKRLAKILRRKFVDTDDEIKKVTNLTIPQIFSRYGEIRFRSEEKLVVKRVATMESMIISTGGGVVLEEDNRVALANNGILVCLTADPEIVLARVSKKGNRPLIKKDYGVPEIEKMLEERDPFYKQADFFVDTSDDGFDYVVEKIIAFLKEQGEL